MSSLPPLNISGNYRYDNVRRSVYLQNSGEIKPFTLFYNILGPKIQLHSSSFVRSDNRNQFLLLIIKNTTFR